MDGHIDTLAIESAAADAQNSRSQTAFADAINGTWRKGAANYIDCGKLLGEANEELARPVFNSMVKTRLNFEASVARKLMCIAANETLCAHVHKLPSCWSTLYELSQLTVDALKAAFDDGSIHPGMSRKDAIALKPAKKITPKSATAETSASTNPTPELSVVWQTASPEQRRVFLDQLGRAGICAALSPALLAELHDHIVNVTIANASETTPFARYATNMLHCALRSAEEKESNAEYVQKAMAALNCIAKKAGAKGVARSNVVVAEGKKGRK